MFEPTLKEKLKDSRIDHFVSSTMARLELPTGPLSSRASHGKISAGPFLSARYKPIKEAGLADMTFSELEEQDSDMYWGLLQGIQYVQDKTGIKF